MYWTTHRCAAIVSLPKTCNSNTLFDVPCSTPHVSLAKRKTDRWKDLGPWVKKCVEVTDWEPTADLMVQYSATARCYRQKNVSIVHVLRFVQLVTHTHARKHTHTPTTYLHEACDVTQIPALQDIPKT